MEIGGYLKYYCTISVYVGTIIILQYIVKLLLEHGKCIHLRSTVRKVLSYACRHCWMLAHMTG